MNFSVRIVKIFKLMLLTIFTKTYIRYIWRALIAPLTCSYQAINYMFSNLWISFDAIRYLNIITILQVGWCSLLCLEFTAAFFDFFTCLIANLQINVFSLLWHKMWRQKNRVYLREFARPNASDWHQVICSG